MEQYKTQPMMQRAGVHIVVYSLNGTVINDEYEHKLFWFDTKGYWPRCIGEYLFADDISY